MSAPLGDPRNVDCLVLQLTGILAELAQIIDAEARRWEGTVKLAPKQETRRKLHEAKSALRTTEFALERLRRDEQHVHYSVLTVDG